MPKRRQGVRVGPSLVKRARLLSALEKWMSRLFHDMTALPSVLVDLVLQYNARRTGWETPQGANFFVDVLCQTIYDYCSDCSWTTDLEFSVFSLSSGYSHKKNWLQFGGDGTTKMVLCIHGLVLHERFRRLMSSCFFCFVQNPCDALETYERIHFVCMHPDFFYRQLHQLCEKLDKLEDGCFRKRLKTHISLPSPFQWSLIERGMRYYARTRSCLTPYVPPTLLRDVRKRLKKFIM